MMTRIILRLVPAAALAALVSACTGYAPPPYAQLSCMQQDRFDAGADYLNCIRGYEQQTQAERQTQTGQQSQAGQQSQTGQQSQAGQQIGMAPTTAQLSTPAATRAE